MAPVLVVWALQILLRPFLSLNRTPIWSFTWLVRPRGVSCLTGHARPEALASVAAPLSSSWPQCD